MASLGHLAVGIAAARLVVGASTSPLDGRGATLGANGSRSVRPGPRSDLRSQALWTIGLCALALAPDLDVLAFTFGVPYRAVWGHRGATHSLLFTGLFGLAVGIVVGAGRPGFRRICAVTTLVAMSHGILDSLTDGGLGPALFWPFDSGRHFAPVRPIPVAPIALRFVSLRGLRVLAAELVIFSPLILFALWPRRRVQPVRGQDEP